MSSEARSAARREEWKAKRAAQIEESGEEPLTDEEIVEAIRRSRQDESAAESADSMIDAYRAEIETQTERAERLKDALRRVLAAAPYNGGPYRIANEALDADKG